MAMSMEDFDFNNNKKKTSDLSYSKFRVSVTSKSSHPSHLMVSFSGAGLKPAIKGPLPTFSLR